MKRTRKQPQELSLLELLQEVQRRTSTEILPADQQQYITQMMISILQVCVQTNVRPPLGQEMQEIRGQAHVKRALEVAAAGGHHILLVGPPGAGKALLVRTFPSLLPTTPLLYPFREPPSDIGQNAFIGEPTVPGELTLAHGGVLFLKDLDSFDLSLLTSLAQAVERQVVSFPLGEEGAELPAKFILVATVKPCRCGFLGDPVRACRCSVEEIVQYRQRNKEIIRTCFDIEVEVPLRAEDVLRKRSEESSADIRQRVEAARERQRRRYAEYPHLQMNADLRSADEIQHYCQIAPPGEELLKAAIRQLHLTPLQVLRVQAVARTIADLAEVPVIAANHLAEAIQYLSRLVRD